MPNRGRKRLRSPSPSRDTQGQEARIERMEQSILHISESLNLLLQSKSSHPNAPTNTYDFQQPDLSQPSDYTYRGEYLSPEDQDLYDYDPTYDDYVQQDAEYDDYQHNNIISFIDLENEADTSDDLLPGMQRQHPFHRLTKDLLDDIEYKTPIDINENLGQGALCHTASSVYYFTKRIKYELRDGMAFLITTWRGQEHLLPVDQMRVKVKKLGDHLTFSINYAGNQLREDHLPFLDVSASKPPLPQSTVTLKERAKASSCLFLNPKFREHTHLETVGDASRRVKIHCTNPDTNNVLIELEECIRKRTKVPFPRPSIDMTSSSLELGTYLQAPQLTMPEVNRSLQKFLKPFNKKDAEAELTQRHTATLNWQSYEFAKFSTDASLFFSQEQLEAIKSESGRVFDHQKGLKANSNFLSMAMDSSLEAFRRSIYAALKTKHTIRMSIIGRSQPSSIYEPLKNDPLFTPNLWSSSAIESTYELLQAEQEKTHPRRFCLPSGTPCSKYGAVFRADNFTKPTMERQTFRTQYETRQQPYFSRGFQRGQTRQSRGYNPSGFPQQRSGYNISQDKPPKRDHHTRGNSSIRGGRTARGSYNHNSNQKPFHKGPNNNQ